MLPSRDWPFFLPFSPNFSIKAIHSNGISPIFRIQFDVFMLTHSISLLIFHLVIRRYGGLTQSFGRREKIWPEKKRSNNSFDIICFARAPRNLWYRYRHFFSLIRANNDLASRSYSTGDSSNKKRVSGKHTRKHKTHTHNEWMNMIKISPSIRYAIRVDISKPPPSAVSMH